MNLRIEKYCDADKDAVLTGLVELQNFEVPISDTRIPGTLAQAQEYLGTLQKEIRKKRGAFLCAHFGEELAGFIVCWIENQPTPNETDDSTTFGYISDAFVFEKYRRQGIFRQLNDAAQKHLATYPEIKRIRINVLANNSQALAAYRSAGYCDYEVMLEKRL